MKYLLTISILIMALGCKKSVIPTIQECYPCESDTCMIVQDGDVSQLQYTLLGSGLGTLISHGDFSASTGWTIGAGWSIGGGVASFTTTPSTLSTILDNAISEGYYCVIVRFSGVGAATSIEIKLGGVSMSLITAFPENGVIGIYKRLTPGSQLLEIVGGSPSGAINITDIQVYQMSEISFDILNCDTDAVILSQDYADGNIDLYETGDIDTDEKYYHAEGIGIPFTIPATGTNFLIPLVTAQINLDWTLLGLAEGCYCVCIKDNSLLTAENIKNGDFHNTESWSITNTGVNGWAISGGVAEHTPGGAAGDDVLRQTLASALETDINYNLVFTVDSVSGSGNATLTVLYDTATLTNQVLQATTYSSFPTTTTIPITDTAITAIKFSMTAAGLRTVSLDNVSLLGDDPIPCACRTMCVSYAASWDTKAASLGLCNMLLTATNGNNALGFNFEDFTFTHSLRVLGSLRNAKYDFTDEEYYTKSDGQTILVSSAYQKYKELQIMRMPEGAHDILSLMLIHQTFNIEINGVTYPYVKRPGSMAPQWVKRSADAYVVVEVAPKTQNHFNFLG